MNIVFMGTPDFAKESLKALYDAKYNILAVVTNIDKPKGRGMKVIESPVKEFAKEKNIPIFQPLKIRNNTEFIEKIKNLNPDLICVVAYGKILPKELLEIPQYGAINVHGSLLPKYRGAAPIQWAVLNGDKKTGITTMYMDEGMDTGDMILQEETEILDDETTGELWERLSKMGAKLLVKTVNEIENKTVKRQKQPQEGYSLAPMLSKEMASINWDTQSALEIKNLVRGLNPIMGAYSYLNGNKIKFWKVEEIKLVDFKAKFPEILNIENAKSGTVILSNLKKGLYIKTINGIICIKEIQGENAKKMNILEFLKGKNIQEGSIFTNIL